MAKGPEIRTDFQRDVDKFPYSLPFRRLAKITQVVSDDNSSIPHNRMTHSLKVAQVGHRLAQTLLANSKNTEGLRASGGIDPDVVYAAGLAHDIGHPPFGHIGEAVLDAVALENSLDGFEGNAQTFRILTRLTRHRPEGIEPGATTTGMNLSPRTVSASVKYPWPRDSDPTSAAHRKFGYYEDDASSFARITKPYLPRPGVKNLEAQIMDWADDITYAVHDMEDFYTLGLIPLDRLRQVPVVDTDDATQTRHESPNPLDDEFAAFWNYAEARLEEFGVKTPGDIRQTFQSFAARFPSRPFSETSLARSTLGRIMSDIITDAAAACSIRPDGQLTRGEDMDAVISILKQLTWYYVIDTPVMAKRQRGQARVLAEVTREHIRWVSACISPVDPSGKPLGLGQQAANMRQLPPLLNEIIRASGILVNESRNSSEKAYVQAVARSVIDYIALQTENQIYEDYELMINGVG